MKKRAHLLAAIFLFAAPAAPAIAQDGDAAAGEKVFNKCKACHMVGDKAKNRVGPQLNGVIGRQAGTVEGFRYSKINQAAGEAGLTWTPELIVEYLPDPNAFLKKYLEEAGKGDQAKGRTRMAFKLKDEEDRKNVVAYLAQFSEKK